MRTRDSHLPASPSDWDTPTWREVQKLVMELAAWNQSRLPSLFSQGDLENAALAKVWRGRDRLSFPSWSALKAYLNQVVKSQTKELYKQAKRNYEYLNEDQERSLADTSQSDPDLRMSLQHAFQSLTDKDREFIMLRYVNGLKLKEIAERRGVTPQAIQKQHNRVKDKLMTILEIETRTATVSSSAI